MRSIVIPYNGRFDRINMTEDFSYTITFVLDKAYYTQCYQQTVVIDHSWRAYAKAIFFIVFGAVLVLFTPINSYVAWFIFALGLVEALSVYYQQPWWVARQLLTKAANNEVTLTIDKQGIHSHSFYVDSMIAWSDITRLEQDTQGWLVQHSKGKNYLPQRLLSPEASGYLSVKAEAI